MQWCYRCFGHFSLLLRIINSIQYHRQLLPFLPPGQVGHFSTPTQSRNSTMAPPSKSRIAMYAANYPVPDADGKIPFNAKVGADFESLKNMMAVTGFFVKWDGPMTFFDAPEHHNWRRTYARASWSNGWNAAKKKSAEALLGAQVPGAWRCRRQC